ncbi:ribose-5-phosphate isomerase RpiA [Candidatus Sumerlaeota bacterium]|nr:ribose-5-phosphate isomerase RpiA [Candidatus Sumerlaeota bacterium]
MGLDEQKKNAAVHAVSLIRTGMTVGLGTGTTAAFALHAIRERMEREGLVILGVCTSSGTQDLANRLSIPTAPLSTATNIEIYIDGADQIDHDGNIIKGGGGALLREKLVAVNSARRVIMTDASKRVDKLGGRVFLPIEVVRFGHDTTISRIASGVRCTPHLRRKGGVAFVTDEGNHIVDCEFPDGIASPPSLAQTLDAITGVVETGLFIGLCDLLIVGSDTSVHLTEFPRKEVIL